MTDDFTFYFGAASGSSRKALRMLEEPNVMISYATKNNRPWPGIESLFIDSGGYSLMLQTGEHDPVDEYIEYVREVEPEYYALQDYPCEPEILQEYDRTVEDHIVATTNRAIKNLDRDAPGTPVPVLQGWKLEDYVACIDDFRKYGILPAEKVGIGSVCRRHAQKDIAEIIRYVDSEVDANLHAFGVKTSVLKLEGIRSALSSADSLAYDYAAQYNQPTDTWRSRALEYLKMKMKLEEETEETIQDYLVM